MKSFLKQSRFWLAGLLVALPLARACAGSDAFEFFSEEAKVITASRREQTLQEVPMAMDVITRQDIENSGAVNIWDLMRFRVGLDVLDARSVDGQRGIVAVRGFPQEYVHNIQVLIDGRSVYEPVSGGAYWEELPVQMQDIERIEIIRGPNAALYGSGAALGVINIITRKPQGPTRATVDVSGGNLHAMQTAESLESSAGPLAYRASYSTHYQDGFPETPSDARGNDYVHDHKANIRMNWDWHNGSQLELFSGGAWTRSGVEALPSGQQDYAQDFEMLKWSQQVGSNSTVEFLAARNNYIQTIDPALYVPRAEAQALQYDAELLHRLSLWDDRLKTTYGINYRHVHANSVYYFGDGIPQERLYNGYFNQSIALSEQWFLTGGFSVEHYDKSSGGADTQTNYQFAPVWAPSPNHSFRASYSVAHTIPVDFDTDVQQLLPGSGLFDKSPALQPQKVVSYDIGYRGMADRRRLQFNTSLYYTVIHNIDTFTVAFDNPAYAYTFQFNNSEQAIARGIESEVKYQIDRRNSLYANYTVEKVTDWNADVTEVTQNTPLHKLNVGGVAGLSRDLLLTLNVGYKDAYVISSTSRGSAAAIPAYWRLDARLAYTIPRHPNVKLYVAGQNLAVSKHVEFADGLAVPRTVLGGVSLKFGGGA